MTIREKALHHIALWIAEASFCEKENCISSALYAWKEAENVINCYKPVGDTVFIGLKYLCIENIERINFMRSTQK